ncbi:MAG TPA: DCC1-like thiol-disulfide oxidoreductase family protein [Polyangiaceae bacterium]
MVDSERPKARGRNAFGDFLQARYFTADTRWLGVFRIGFGSLLTLDCARRFYNAREYYSNDGFLPNHFSLFRPMGDEVFSLLHAFSSVSEVRVVMALMLVVFLCYTVGFKTRLAQVLGFLSITSLDARNLFVENGGDVLVNLMAAYSMFLPLGRRLSVDAVLASLKARHENSPAALNDRERPPDPEVPFVSLIVMAMLLQLAVIYFFNAVHKDGVGWRNGSAIYWFLQQNRIVTQLGIALRGLPFEVYQAFTYGALAIEWSLPAILLFPFFRVWMHRIALVLGVGLHGGIALTSRLGPFSYAMMLFYLPFLGERDWQLLGRWFGRDARKRTVIFDVDCGICLLTSRILKRLDPFQRLTFLGNDRAELFPPGVDAAMAEKSVVVVDPEGRVHLEEQALFQIGRALPFGVVPLFWLKIPGLMHVGRALYRTLARNRIQVSVWLGLGACGLEAPRPELVTAAAQPGQNTLRGHWDNTKTLVRESLAAAFVVMLAVQVANDNGWMNRRFKVHRPAWVVHTVNTFRLLEGWGMFAPEPPYDDGRVVVDGRTKDGRKLDPFTGKEPDFDPFPTHGWGHQQFWCDYNNRIRFEWHVPNRQHLKDYLRNIHKYDRKPEDELASFDVWWVHGKPPKPGQAAGEPGIPQKLVSFGVVSDSGARPWLTKRPASKGKP